MTGGATTILVVDDEPPIRRFLRTTLAAHDYRVVEAGSGAEALERLRHERPDLVILDLGLPDLDGMEIIRRVRAASAMPIVVLSSRGDEKIKVEALDLGADDYVTKPFGMEELMARVRTALRHRLQEQGAQPLFRTGRMTVDLTRRLVTIGAVEVKLSPKEYEVLQQFVIHAGKVLTHRHLLREVWGSETAGDAQYLRVFVRQLRQKLEPAPERPSYIVTEPGVGYRLQLIEPA